MKVENLKHPKSYLGNCCDKKIGGFVFSKCEKKIGDFVFSKFL